MTKGASKLDKKAHGVYEFATRESLAWHETNVICPHCGRELETSYCEERLYMVRCQNCKTVTLVEGSSPRDAAEKIGIIAMPADEWCEDYGECLWWSFPIQEPPYLGSPITYYRNRDETVPEWCTHFTLIQAPTEEVAE